MLTQQQQHDFLQQLQWQIEQEDDWVQEWKRISGLQQQLVREHGAAGLEIWLKDCGLWTETVCELDAVPAGCPWHFPGGMPQAVQQLWAPLRDCLPHMVEQLQACCRGVFALQRYGEWLLVYVLEACHQQQSYWTLRIAGAPANTAAMTAAGVPVALRPVYRVHNGFGYVTEELWSYRSLLPWQLLEPFGQSLEKRFAADVLECMSWDDNLDHLVPFYVQTNGSVQCFEQQDGPQRLLQSVTVDGNLQKVGHAELYRFLDDRLLGLDSDERDD